MRTLKKEEAQPKFIFHKQLRALECSIMRKWEAMEILQKVMKKLGIEISLISFDESLLISLTKKSMIYSLIFARRGTILPSR